MSRIEELSFVGRPVLGDEVPFLCFESFESKIEPEDMKATYLWRIFVL